jgi:hypothetical protein
MMNLNLNASVLNGNRSQPLSAREGGASMRSMGSARPLPFSQTPSPRPDFEEPEPAPPPQRVFGLAGSASKNIMPQKKPARPPASPTQPGYLKKLKEEYGETDDKLQDSLGALARLIEEGEPSKTLLQIIADKPLATACLRAHDYDPPTALKAMKAYANCKLHPWSPHGAIEAAKALDILSHGFAELLPVRDTEGHAIILLGDSTLISAVTAKFSIGVVLKAITWLIIQAVRDSAETQLCGLAILEDFTGYTQMSNVGFVMSTELGEARTAMALAFPANSPFKLGPAIAFNVPDGPRGMPGIANSGWGVGALFNPKTHSSLKTSATKAYAEKVIARFDAETTLPARLGGSCKYNFGEWLTAKAAQLGIDEFANTHAYADMPTSKTDASYTPYAELPAQVLVI